MAVTDPVAPEVPPPEVPPPEVPPAEEPEGAEFWVAIQDAFSQRTFELTSSGAAAGILEFAGSGASAGALEFAGSGDVSVAKSGLGREVSMQNLLSGIALPEGVAVMSISAVSPCSSKVAIIPIKLPNTSGVLWFGSLKYSAITPVILPLVSFLTSRSRSVKRKKSSSRGYP